LLLSSKNHQKYWMGFTVYSGIVIRYGALEYISKGTQLSTNGSYSYCKLALGSAIANSNIQNEQAFRFQITPYDIINQGCLSLKIEVFSCFLQHSNVKISRKAT